MEATYAHIYLSPHLDDAAFSCGGRIWTQTRAGKGVLVVTVFAGGPAPEVGERLALPLLSPFARSLHQRWELVADEVTVRREEDAAALALLGADYLHWDYLDCVYRQGLDGAFLYASEESLWGVMHPAEEGLVAELASWFTELPLALGGTVYVPLAAGSHVDHRIVRRAAEAAGTALRYYEDYPYAVEPGVVEAARGEGDWQAELIVLSEEALRAKVAAIACYRSQLSTFWRDTAEMAAQVRTFAEAVAGGEGLAERYWHRRGGVPQPAPRAADHPQPHRPCPAH